MPPNCQIQLCLATLKGLVPAYSSAPPPHSKEAPLNHHTPARYGARSEGRKLIQREAGNSILPACPGLRVKDSYWRWPERNLAGNAIYFCAQVLGLSIHDAMRQITGT